MPQQTKAIPEALCLHLLNLLPELGPKRLMALASGFDSFSQALYAPKESLLEILKDPDLVEKIARHREQADPGREASLLKEFQINLLTYKDPSYPALLREIPQPPALLYYKGLMDSSEELCIAVVGTRMITSYGRAATQCLVEPLVEAGATLVSGLAYGVDSQAQQIAVKKNKRTIAVLGGGLDDKSLYPPQHSYLARQITGCGGAIISEYPIGTPPLKHHFIARNRIISGLAVATLVVECGLKSGSLITAKYALEQNRTVYAVPGPIYSIQSQGPNNLIKMGARLASEAGDILDDLNLKSLPDQKQAALTLGDSPAETAILEVLGGEPLHVNEIIKRLSLKPGEAVSALTFLEMKGRVKNLGGQQYILSRRS